MERKEEVSVVREKQWEGREIGSHYETAPKTTDFEIIDIHNTYLKDE